MLIEFPSEKSGKDIWTVDDATKGIAILGGTGSGKTSASGRTLAHKFLNEGWGGIVLCAKTDEAKLWEQYCKDTNRIHDRIIFENGAKHESGKDLIFNPIDYELQREGEGKGDTQNIVNIFMNIYRMGNRIASEGDTSKEERFWDSALKRCIGKSVELLKLALENLTVDNICKVLISCSTKIDNGTEEGVYAMNSATLASCINYVDDRINEIPVDEEDSKYIDDDTYFGVLCLAKAYLNLQGKEDYVSKDMYDIEFNTYLQVHSYFLKFLPSLDPKTKSTIIESFMGLAEPFLGGILNRHFSGATNLFPEETFRNGKIIILNFPIKEYLDVGIIAQCVFKLMFQQAIERRKVGEYPRPAFLWADEAHMFINPYDQLYLTTARSARAATVYLTQNISNYLAVMGSGSDSAAKVDSLLGNLSTKIFHANMDAVTNEYASRLIGNDYKELESGGTSHTFLSLSDTQNKNYNTTLVPQVLPKEFTVLRSGGDNNKGKVDAIVMVSGKQWKSKKNYYLATFTQKLEN